MERERMFNRRTIFFSVTVFLMFLIIIVLILSPQSKAPGVNRDSGWTPSMMREYAGKLRGEGLIKQAASAYEEYLAKTGIDNQTRANIYYTIGTMFMKERNYEDALSYFYKAEMFKPDSRLKKDIGINIVAALENMGKGLDAEYALEKQTALSGQEIKKKPRRDIVAKIGKREISMGEINDAIAKLPEQLVNQYSQNELKKLEFLQQYIFTELLYDKGKKLQYDKSAEIRERVEEAAKQLLVAKVAQEEIGKRVKIEPSDVKLYYQANKDRYIEKESEKQKSFEEVKARVEYEYRRKKENTVTNELFRQMLKSKDVEIYSWKFKPKKEESEKQESPEEQDNSEEGGKVIP